MSFRFNPYEYSRPASRRHVPVSVRLFSSKQRASSATSDECKQGVRSLRPARKLRREPRRPFCPCTRLLRYLFLYLPRTNLASLPFSLSFTPRPPVHPGLGLAPVFVAPARTRLSLVKRKMLPSEPPLRSVAREVRSLLLSPPPSPRPCTIHGAVMATQLLWGLPRAKPPPCTMGKNDQYLNPPRYAFPLRDARLSLGDAPFPGPASPTSMILYRVESVYLSPLSSTIHRLRASSGTAKRFESNITVVLVEICSRCSGMGHPVGYECDRYSRRFFIFFDATAREGGLERLE